MPEHINQILTFTSGGVNHKDIEEARLARLEQIREAAYREGVADAMSGTVKPAPTPRPKRRNVTR